MADLAGPSPARRTDDDDSVTSSKVPWSDLSNAIKQRVALARFALWWEQTWPALWPATGIIGLYFLFALTGALEGLPLLLKWATLVAVSAAVFTRTWGRRHLFAIPSWEQGLRRLETMNRLQHRPLSTYTDKPANKTGSDQLWQAHRRWLDHQLSTLRVRLPAAGLAKTDPYALRAPLILCLLSAFVIAGQAAPTRLTSALYPGFTAYGTTGRLDAWISPPDYTARAPFFLDPDAAQIADVPSDSTLHVQIFGGSTPTVTLGTETIATQTRTEATDTAFESTATISEDTLLSITQGTQALGMWSLSILPDQPPSVRLIEQVEPTRRQTLKFVYQLNDDYGVVALRAAIGLDRFFVFADKPVFSLDGQPTPRAGFDHRIDELVAEPIETFIELPLPGLRVTDASHTAYKDLTAHPWAGLPVTIELLAKDDAQQEGRSRTISLTLPAREFKEPLAAAIIEQRRRLALSPLNRGSVAGFLNAFTLDAERTIEDKSVYLGLRAVYWRLTRARQAGELAGVSELLWDLAQHIEDGDLSLTERDLRAAREALTQALAEGANADEIEQLMQDLKSALARYLDELQDRQPTATEQSGPQPEDGQKVERSDLEDMLDAIGDLARTGARDQAQDRLSQLDQILENIETPQGDNALTESEQSLSDAIGEMSEMIERQRNLMDDTFQHGQGAEAGSGEPDGTGDNQGQAQALEGLREQQETLRQQLQELMGKLDENGQPVPDGLERAAEAMENAESRLAKGRSDAATGAQGQAIDQLREGTQALADAMFEAMAENGDPGGQRSGGSQTDPLGRPTGAGQNESQATRLPDEMERQRARQILEELRKRAAERGRPQSELDYLERLLRRF